MSAKAIENVLVIGATGSIGPAIVEALQAHPQHFAVSILTRPSSLERTRSMYSTHGIPIYTVDYSSPDASPDDFKSAFQGQHAIVSAIATFTVQQQATIIDAAIASGTVQRFVPSEYGIDTSDSKALREYLPVASFKTDVVKYLRQHESEMSWSAICTGAFFDWSFAIPGLMGWNLPARTALLFDGGNVEYEASNLLQIGRAVANSLSSTPSPGFANGQGKGTSMLKLTANAYVYMNSFTVTQNDVLRALEEVLGEKFTTHHAKALEFWEEARQRAENSVPNFKPTQNSDYADGIPEMITAAIYGLGELNQFSKHPGLWNEALALPQEDLVTTLSVATRTPAAGN